MKPPLPSEHAPDKPDYVLGTRDDELARLGLQHSLWREFVLDAWRRAGIREGSKVVDVGAGPGFATMDLAAIVGAKGQVAAVEISSKFTRVLREKALALGLNQVSVHEVDLMREDIPMDGMDAAWCRWVCMFVADVGALVGRVHQSLAAGGVAVFHEYDHYETYGLQPGTPGIDAFVREAMESFRSRGGDANIAGKLLGHLRARGFTIESVKPIARAARPHEPLWQWPAGFIRTYVPRLVETGQVDDAFAQRVFKELAAAEQDPQSVMITPTVLEIIARK